MEDDHASDGLLLRVVRTSMSPLPAGRVVSHRGFWEGVQVAVTLGLQGWLKDGVGEGDGRLLVLRPQSSQRLVARELGSGKVHLLEAIY